MWNSCHSPILTWIESHLNKKTTCNNCYFDQRSITNSPWIMPNLLSTVLFRYFQICTLLLISRLTSLILVIFCLIFHKYKSCRFVAIGFIHSEKKSLRSNSNLVLARNKLCSSRPEKIYFVKLLSNRFEILFALLNFTVILYTESQTVG